MRSVCPSCSGRLLPIVYGYPDASLLEEADAGGVVLGGCMRSWDDPNARCSVCGAGVWRDGSFLVDGVRGVQLTHRRGGRFLVACIGGDGRLVVEERSDDAATPMVTVEAVDRETVLLMLCIERFASADELATFCRHKDISFEGAAMGTIDRFTVDGAGSLLVEAVGGLRVDGGMVDRFTLAVVADLWKQHRFHDAADWRTWLDDHGVEPQTTV